MSGTRWSEAEFTYVLRRAVDDRQPVRVIVDELNKMNPTVRRTYHGVKAVLLSHNINLEDLRGESIKRRDMIANEAKEKAKIKMVSVLGSPIEEEEMARLRSEGSLLEPGNPEEEEPEMSEKDEAELRRRLCERGYKVEKLSPDKKDLDIDVSRLFEGDKMQFAVISCTQIGSKYQQLTHLRSFYQFIQDRDIKVVFHCGDLVDGVDVYKGHEYELFLHGEKAQTDYCVAKYPHMDNGGKTLVIAGNHDYSFMKTAGCDIVENICAKRDDMEYIGAFGAFPKTDFLRVYLQHGKGGGAYARSYKMQKFIEQMAPEIKPDLFFLGHYHSTCALFEYRNVTAFMMGCFQAQTPHERQYGLFPEIGGLIMEVTINDKTRRQTLADMKFEWVPFYIPLENDF